MTYTCTFRRKKLSAATLSELSAKFCAIRDEGMRTGKIRRVVFETTVSENNVPMAYISWNGRVWKGKYESVFNNRAEPVCLFDPREAIK